MNWRLFEKCPKCKNRLNHRDRIFRVCSKCGHDLAIIEGNLKIGEKTKSFLENIEKTIQKKSNKIIINYEPIKKKGSE